MGAYNKLQSLARALADSPEPTFVVALDGTVVSWNAAMADLLGVPAWQAQGRPCPSILAGRTPTGEIVCQLECVVICEARSGRSAPPMDLVVTPRRASRKRRLRVHLVGLKDADGEPLGVLHIVEDVGAQRGREAIGRRFQYVTAGAGEAREREELLSPLTPREREVIALLAKGRTSREIAERLGIQHATARTHVQRIMGKLGAHTRAAALARTLAGGEEILQLQDAAPHEWPDPSAAPQHN